MLITLHNLMSHATISRDFIMFLLNVILCYTPHLFQSLGVSSVYAEYYKKDEPCHDTFRFIRPLSDAVAYYHYVEIICVLLVRVCILYRVDEPCYDILVFHHVSTWCHTKVYPSFFLSLAMLLIDVCGLVERMSLVMMFLDLIMLILDFMLRHTPIFCWFHIGFYWVM